MGTGMASACHSDCKQDFDGRVGVDSEFGLFGFSGYHGVPASHAVEAGLRAAALTLEPFRDMCVDKKWASPLPDLIGLRFWSVGWGVEAVIRNTKLRKVSCI